MKYVPLTDDIHRYMNETFAAEDDFLRELKQEAMALGMPDIHIAPEQLSFLQTLLKALNARYALEIGSLAGYSAIGMARALPDDGKVVAFELKPEYAEFIHKKAVEARLDHKIQLHVGDAKTLLREFKPAVQFDFAFIDAEKDGYTTYLDLLVPLLREGGMVCGDNTLAWGGIADANTTDKTAQALRRFNAAMSAHPQLQSCLVPIADGMTIGVKTSGR